MRPYKYTTKGTLTTFHYTFKQLREFIAHGKEYGDNGVILISRDSKSKFVQYKGFGVIENPITHLHSISIIHYNKFDGKWSSDKEIINPKPVIDKNSYRFVILDFSKPEKKKTLVFKEYEIWMGNCGSMGQGDTAPTEPRKLGEVMATSFKIACVIYEHQNSIDSLKRRMERGDTYIEDIHFGGWCYKPETNSNSWTGKYYESEQEALKSFQK